MSEWRLSGGPPGAAPAQSRLPDALLIQVHTCPVCGCPVLVGERDGAGRWTCRDCGRRQEVPALVYLRA